MFGGDRLSLLGWPRNLRAALSQGLSKISFTALGGGWAVVRVDGAAVGLTSLLVSRRRSREQTIVRLLDENCGYSA